METVEELIARRDMLMQQLTAVKAPKHRATLIEWVAATMNRIEKLARETEGKLA